MIFILLYVQWLVGIDYWQHRLLPVGWDNDPVVLGPFDVILTIIAANSGPNSH